MNWYDALQRIEAMLSAPTDAELLSRWKNFRDYAESQDDPPYHLSSIIDLLHDQAQDDKSGLSILDHGCGPASSLIWIAAMGFTNVHGVDVGGDFDRQNRWARVALGHTEPRFFIYDGINLPFADNAFEVLLSQQVLEHVPENELEAYYREEGRVLRQGGAALHQVPHRLGPYDSHTRTWLLTMLPRPLAQAGMVLIGKKFPEHLHLRWPWIHRRMLRRHLGEPVNLSAERLTKPMRFDYYDGSVRLRRLLGTVCRTPIIGDLALQIASSLVLMETRTTKTRTPDKIHD